MGKLWSFFDVLRKGSAVANPALLKDRGGLTLALTAFLWALCAAAKGLGHEIPVTEADVASIAAGVAIVVGLYVNYASSDKVGLLPAKPIPADLPTLDRHDAVGPPVADRPGPAAAPEPVVLRGAEPDGPDYSPERGY